MSAAAPPPKSNETQPAGAEAPDLPESVLLSDEFRMLKFKVLPCTKRFAHDWTSCAYTHPGEKAARRCPLTYNYTAVACPNIRKSGRCPRGDMCPYSHNTFEYWLHSSRYRTQLCSYGHNCQRNVCFFAHGISELREPANPAAAAAAAAAPQPIAGAAASHPATTAAVSAWLGGPDAAAMAAAQSTGLPLGPSVSAPSALESALLMQQLGQQAAAMAAAQAVAVRRRSAELALLHQQQQAAAAVQQQHPHHASLLSGLGGAGVSALPHLPGASSIWAPASAGMEALPPSSRALSMAFGGSADPSPAGVFGAPPMHSELASLLAAALEAGGHHHHHHPSAAAVNALGAAAAAAASHMGGDAAQAAALMAHSQHRMGAARHASLTGEQMYSQASLSSAFTFGHLPLQMDVGAYQMLVPAME